MKFNNTIDQNNITVGIDQMQEMCGVGKNTAYKIGKEAGAIVHIGRRTLFNVKKVQDYMDRMTEEGE